LGILCSLVSICNSQRARGFSALLPNQPNRHQYHRSADK
jgi:hypothetical protein